MQSAAAIDSARAIVAAHHAYTLWGLIAAVVFEAVAIVLLLAHRGWAWIVTAPLTNIRLLNGIVMSSFFIVSLFVVGYATHEYPPVDVILSVGSFILLMCGLDVTQFGIKRWTTDPTVASNQNVQAGITPGTPTSPPAPPLAPASDMPPAVNPAPLPPPPPGPVHTPDPPIRPLGPQAQPTPAPTVAGMQPSTTGVTYSRGD